MPPCIKYPAVRIGTATSTYAPTASRHAEAIGCITMEERMPNYTDTVLKLFVRSEHAKHVNGLINSLASPGLDFAEAEDRVTTTDSNTWTDFQRLLPVPDTIPYRRDDALYREALTVVEGRWPTNIAEPTGPYAFTTPDELANAFSAISPDHADALRRVRHNAQHVGATDWHAWCTSTWGTKWNGDAGRPTVGSAEGIDEYEDFNGATMITYRIQTAWSEPSGWLSALMTQCEIMGIGMRAWVSHEDGGSRWNPLSEEWVTIWERLYEYDLDMQNLTASDIMVLAGRGLHFGLDESALKRSHGATQDS